MLSLLATLPFVVSASEMAPSLARLLAAEPSGRYVGDKDVLGAHIHAVMTYNDAAGTMDFQLSGVLAVDCPGEPFTMDGDNVMLTNIENDSDCIKSTLEQHDTTLKSIEYDAASDELTVKVKYSIIDVHVTLTKVPTPAFEATTACLDYCKSLFNDSKNKALLKNCEAKCTNPKEMVAPTLTASGACMDVADQKLWTGDGKATFHADLSTCGHQCLGGADCTSKCIKKDFGYSVGCSTCFGEITGCTKDHCMWDCLHASGSRCKNCVDEHCTPAFETCSGLTPPSNTAALEHLLAAEPTGRYVGDKDVLGAKIHAVMTYNDAAGTMDFQLSGVLAVNCPGEPFTMSNGNVMLTDIENDSDCIKSTLEQHDTKLKSIEYDAASDELTVKVKYSFIDVHVTLTKVSPILTASGACMDVADQKLWNGDGKATFNTDLSKCGRPCWGDAGCTSKCIKKDFGYSVACSTCFGALTGCTKDHCMWDCMNDANGSKCSDCVDEHCTPAFETCSGLTPPSNAAEELRAPEEGPMHLAQFE